MSKIATTVIMVLMLNCLGAEAHAADVWQSSVLIKHVYPLSDGSFVLRLDSNSDHPSCTSIYSPKYYMVKVGENGVTTEASNKLYSVALLAAASGKRVSFGFSDSSSDCFINRLQVDF